MTSESRSARSPQRDDAALGWLGRVLVLLVLWMGLGSYSWLSFGFQSDLLAFFSRDDSTPAVRLTRKMMEGPLRENLILSLSDSQGSGPPVEAAREFATALREVSGVSRVQNGADEDFDAAFFETYFPRRYLWAQPDRSGGEFWSQRALEHRLERTRRFLATPAAGAYRELFPRDPLLLFRDRVIEMVQANPSRAELVDGQFVGVDGSALLLVRLERGLSFDRRVRILRTIEERFQPHEANGLDLRMSGALPFEVHAEGLTRRDMGRVGILSAVAVLAICLLFFRSVVPLLLVLACISSGMLVGLTATLSIFGTIHGLTLAFGAALIGVGVDYPLHFLNDLNREGGSGRSALSRVLRGLLLGGGTTAVGFGAFASTGASALAQVATFASLGLLACLATSLWLGPIWPGPVGRGGTQRKLSALFSRFIGGAPLWGTRAMGAALVCGLVFGASRVVWNTSPSALNPAPPEMVRNDELARAALGTPQTIWAVTAETDAEVVEKSRQLRRRLEERIEGEVPERVHSVSAFVLPQKLQERNRETASSPAARRALSAALEASGFELEAFAPALQEMSDEAVPALSLRELRSGPLAPLIEPFYFEDEELKAGFLYVEGRDGEQRDIPATEGAFRYDPDAFIEEAFAGLTQSLQNILWTAAVLMLLMVGLRYRALRPVLEAFLPAFVAAWGALAFLGLGGPLHVFHALGALVVLAMGIDYGAFLVEARRADQEAPWPSLVAAACSTVASFGALSLSELPALRAIGSTLAVGIVLVFVLCMLSAAISSEQRIVSTLEGDR